jgi:hypothetical protein
MRLELVLLPIVVDRTGPRLKRHFRGRQDRIEDAEDRQPQPLVLGILTTEYRATVRVTRGRSGRRSGLTTLGATAAASATAATAASALGEDRRGGEYYER